MNVLEKVLEEIKGIEDEYCHGVHSSMFCMGACSMAADVKEIIYSHLEAIFQISSDDEKSIPCTVSKDGVLSPYDDTYDVVIHCSSKQYKEQTVKLLEDSNWIPVEERLPEEDGVYVVTLDGEICGEEKPFSGLAEFKTGKWIDDEEDYKCILAWKPLPEPYRPEEG